MSRLLPDSYGEVIGTATVLLTAAGTLWGRRHGGLASFWNAIISFAAAPVERALYARKANAYEIDNTRLAQEIDAKDREISRLRAENQSLRALLPTDSLAGSLNAGGGNVPTLPSLSSPTNDSGPKTSSTS